MPHWSNSPKVIGEYRTDEDHTEACHGDKDTPGTRNIVIHFEFPMSSAVELQTYTTTSGKPLHGEF